MEIDLALVSPDGLFIGSSILAAAVINGVMRHSPPSNYGIRYEIMELTKAVKSVSAGANRIANRRTK